MNEQREWVSLSLASGLGPAGFWNLVKHFGSPRAVLNAPSGELTQASGVRPAQTAGLADPTALREAARTEIDRLRERGARPLAFPEADYPELLRQTACPPPVLYICGSTPLLNRPSVALVGSRAATSYGRRAAFSLAGDLAGRGVTVVSGLAAGIDGEAHAGCLAAHGTTVAVLGCGLDVVYPRSNWKLYEKIAEHGVLITEYPLGTKPEGFRFPARNRIIAGLSHAVVVVEAARKSGSLITVQYALEEGREVFAVPGQIDSVKSRGTHWLLQQGASLIVSAEDIIDHLNLVVEPKAEIQEESYNTTELQEDSLSLLAVIEPYPMPRDLILRLSGLGSARLSELLLLLELEGLVELVPGDEIRRLN